MGGFESLSLIDQTASHCLVPAWSCHCPENTHQQSTRCAQDTKLLQGTSFEQQSICASKSNSKSLVLQTGSKHHRPDVHCLLDGRALRRQPQHASELRDASGDQLMDITCSMQHALTNAAHPSLLPCKQGCAKQSDALCSARTSISGSRSGGLPCQFLQPKPNVNQR